MPSAPERGTLLIADLSGHTEYLVHSEIEHSTVIVADLLDRVIAEIETSFTVNGTEGDTVLASAPEGALHAEDLLAAADAIYARFRYRALSVAKATQCGCNACELAPDPDLKLVAHHGSFVRRWGGPTHGVDAAAEATWALGRGGISGWSRDSFRRCRGLSVRTPGLEQIVPPCAFLTGVAMMGAECDAIGRVAGARCFAYTAERRCFGGKVIEPSRGGGCPDPTPLRLEEILPVRVQDRGDPVANLRPDGQHPPPGSPKPSKDGGGAIYRST